MKTKHINPNMPPIVIDTDYCEGNRRGGYATDETCCGRYVVAFINGVAYAWECVELNLIAPSSLRSEHSQHLGEYWQYDSTPINADTIEQQIKLAAGRVYRRAFVKWCQEMNTQANQE